MIFRRLEGFTRDFLMKKEQTIKVLNFQSLCAKKKSKEKDYGLISTKPEGFLTNRRIRNYFRKWNTENGD
jgi:hypothetical protein